MTEDRSHSPDLTRRWNASELRAIFTNEMAQAIEELDEGVLDGVSEVQERLLHQYPEIMRSVEPSKAGWQQARESQTELGAIGTLGVLIFFLGAVPLLMSAASLIRQLWGSMPSVQLFGTAPWVSALLWFGAALLLAALGILLVVTSEAPPNEHAKKARSLFVSDLRQEIRSALVQLVNDMLAERRGKELALETSEARDLVELNNADVLESKFITRTIKFVRSHRASAIGISGPRGVGKTTIMQKVCNHDPEDYLGVYLPAPVSYAPDDFVRLLHREVLRQALREEGATAPEAISAGFKRRRTTIGRALTFMILMYTGLGIIVLGRNGFRITPLTAYDVVGGTLILAAVVVILLTILPALGAVRTRHTSAVVDLCKAELSRLDWASKTQATSKNSFKWTIFTFDDQDQVELTERAISHADLVTSFKSFATRYAELTGRQLIVAIDELDKMSDCKDLLAAVNGMKDLFRGNGTHFLVSVSEDALANFALRGVPIRDAFDSSFDEVISVARFDVEDAKALLARRVIKFPDILVLFCHALSGGLPRDLIRTARHCIATREGDDAPPVTTSEAVKVVVQQQLEGILQGALHQALARQTPDTDGRVTGDTTDSASPDSALPSDRFSHEERRAILECHHLLESATSDTEAAVRDCRAKLESRRSPNGSQYFGSLIAMIATLEAAYLYFARPRTVESWAHERESGQPEIVAGRLARCVADVALDPGFALANVERLRVFIDPGRPTEVPPSSPHAALQPIGDRFP